MLFLVCRDVYSFMSEQKDQEVAAMAELFLHEQVNRNTVKTDITLNVFYFIFNFFLQFFSLEI